MPQGNIPPCPKLQKRGRKVGFRFDKKGKAEEKKQDKPKQKIIIKKKPKDKVKIKIKKKVIEEEKQFPPKSLLEERKRQAFLASTAGIGKQAILRAKASKRRQIKGADLRSQRARLLKQEMKKLKSIPASQPLRSANVIKKARSRAKLKSIGKAKKTPHAPALPRPFNIPDEELEDFFGRPDKPTRRATLLKRFRRN